MFSPHNYSFSVQPAPIVMLYHIQSKGHLICICIGETDLSLMKGTDGLVRF